MVYRFREQIRKAKTTGFGHIFGANIVNQIILFASSFILIRVLSKSEYGIYSYALNIYSFFALLCGCGMESAALQMCSEKADNPQKAEGYLKFAILVGSGFNLLLGAAIGISAAFFTFSMEGVNEILGLYVILPFLTTIFNCIQTYYRYNFMNAVYSKLMVVNTVLILIGSVSGAVFFKVQGLVIFREFAFVFSILCGIAVYKFPLYRILKAIQVSMTEKIDMLKIAFISMLNIATGQLLYLLDVFLIGILIPNELIVASYKTATIIPNALVFIPSALVVYIYPYFAQHQNDKKWVKSKFLAVLKYFVPFNAILTLGLVVFAPLIIKILFGAQYLDAVPAFRILSVSYFFSASFRKIIGNLLVTQRKLKVNFWIGVMEGVLNLISNWILISFLGAIGAAITTLVICIVSSVISLLYFFYLLEK